MYNKGFFYVSISLVLGLLYGPLLGQDLLQTSKACSVAAPFNTFNPPTIWNETSTASLQPKEATVTLTVKAFGTTVSVPKPIDAVLVIDESGSMAWHDSTEVGCSGYRTRHERFWYAKEAAKSFIDQMSSTDDRVSILFFAGSNTNTHPIGPFTSDKNVLMDSLAVQDSARGNGTPLYYAANQALDYIEQNGRADVTKAVILLTDGASTESSAASKLNTLVARIQNLLTIRVFAVGMGTPRVCESQSSSISDTSALGDIAEAAGTPFFYSPSGANLSEIYNSIAMGLRYYAIAQVAPGEPLIIDKLPSHVHYVTNSWAPGPNHNAINMIGNFTLSGNNKLAWEVAQVGVNTTLEIQYRITCDSSGLVSLNSDTNFVVYVDAQDRPGVKFFVPAPQVRVVEGLNDSAISILGADPLDHARIRLQIKTDFFDIMGIDSINIYYSDVDTITDENADHVTFSASTIKNNGGYVTVSSLSETTLYYFTVTMTNFAGFTTVILPDSGKDAETLPFKWELISNVLVYPNPCVAGHDDETRFLTSAPPSTPLEKGTYLQYALNRDSEVKVGIYSQLGDDVFEQKVNRGELGGRSSWNYLFWNGKNHKGKQVGAGSYLLIIHAMAKDGTEDRVTWKIGVVNK